MAAHDSRFLNNGVRTLRSGSASKLRMRDVAAAAQLVAEVLTVLTRARPVTRTLYCTSSRAIL